MVCSLEYWNSTRSRRLLIDAISVVGSHLQGLQDKEMKTCLKLIIYLGDSQVLCCNTRMRVFSVQSPPKYPYSPLVRLYTWSSRWSNNLMYCTVDYSTWYSLWQLIINSLSYFRSIHNIPPSIIFNKLLLILFSTSTLCSFTLLSSPLLYWYQVTDTV